MPYLYNGSPILAPLNIMSNRQAFQVETLSLKQTKFTTEAQRWELSFGIANNGNEAASFLAHTADYYRKKIMVMPQLNGPRSQMTFAGTLSIGTGLLGGDSEVAITASGSGVLPAGYFVKFSNHDKVYVVTETATFSNNTVNVNIFPSLTADVLVGANLLLGDNVTIRYQLDLTATQGITFNDGIISSVVSIKLIEAL